MRAFGSLIDIAFKSREPLIPDRRLARANPPALNRLEEGIRDLFTITVAWPVNWKWRPICWH